MSAVEHVPTVASVESAPTPTPTWTWSDSWWVEIRAYGWLIGVTLPITTFVLTLIVGLGGWFTMEWNWLGTLGSALAAAFWLDVVSIPFAFAAVVVALPFTYLLGRALRPVESRRNQITATSVLAGTLAALPMVSPDTLLIFVPMSIAAGAAGALARRGEFRRADRLAQTAATAPAEPIAPAEVTAQPEEAGA
ncbi:hypothetical protein ASF23_08510 [Curtobacterium sp. Leaf261]|nr:hypothetical protein ASF23_08510 [Curtobacterium sp. Leaf261]